MGKENTKIHCHVRDANNNIKYFCTITYRQGIQFVLTVYSKESIELQDNCFVCFDGQNNRYILNNLLFEEHKGKSLYGKNYYFQSLITDTSKHYISEKKLYEVESVKFKSIYFTFPLINSFFYNIDYLKTGDYSTNEHFLKYHKNCECPHISINGFKVDLLAGFNYGGCKIGGDGGHVDLIKSIKVSSEKEQPLQDFIDIIISLVNFFSICLRKKLLLSRIWSNPNENTLNINAEIKTFQYHILNHDYEDVSPFKSLATYALLKNNFEEIVNNFFITKKGPYEIFPVFCDLYMRYNDSPVEILPQMKFLPLMQGIEAYIGNFDYNKLQKVPKKSKKALKKFKEDNYILPFIDTVDFPQFVPFQTKINNTIEKLSIENIIKFKLDENKNYKLINQMVKIRNYYTHYGKVPNINDEDFYDAMDYAKIICEILIMKELQFTEQQIKISLDNNYFFLKQWNNKYCSLVEDRIVPKGLENCIYVGEADTFYKSKYRKYSLYYSISKNGKEVILYAKNMMKYGRIRKKTVTLPIDDSTYNSLEKEFKYCYDNYIESEKQIQYRKELRNK